MKDFNEYPESMRIYVLREAVTEKLEKEALSISKPTRFIIKLLGVKRFSQTFEKYINKKKQQHIKIFNDYYNSISMMINDLEEKYSKNILFPVSTYNIKKEDLLNKLTKNIESLSDLDKKKILCQWDIDLLKHELMLIEQMKIKINNEYSKYSNQNNSPTITCFL